MLFTVVGIIIVLVANSFAIYVDGPTNRVVNGADVELGDIPYIVSLRYFHAHICGASILDDIHILTAAHCVEGRTTASISIQYGVTKISKNGKFINVAKVVIHENYDMFKSYANDIAILTLVSPLPFDELVQPVTLPDQDESTPAGTTSILAGWGYSSSSSSVMENLQRADLVVYSDEECKKIHGKEIDIKHHLCSGIPQGGIGQCSGDDGGPLMANGKQIGIVSWYVMPCAIPRFPGIYCRLSNYIDWIHDNIDTTRHLS